jgi:hypothetical protein
MQEGRPIAYFSDKSNGGTHSNYHVYDKEFYNGTILSMA